LLAFIGHHSRKLGFREQRTDVENVHDVVEKDLAKEIDVILSCADVLADCIEQITEQIRKNRSARYHLEKVALLK
jgi:tektin-1